MSWNSIPLGSPLAAPSETHVEDTFDSSPGFTRFIPLAKYRRPRGDIEAPSTGGTRPMTPYERAVFIAAFMSCVFAVLAPIMTVVSGLKYQECDGRSDDCSGPSISLNIWGLAWLGSWGAPMCLWLRGS